MLYGHTHSARRHEREHARIEEVYRCRVDGVFEAYMRSMIDDLIRLMMNTHMSTSDLRRQRGSAAAAARRHGRCSIT